MENNPTPDTPEEPQPLELHPKPRVAAPIRKRIVGVAFILVTLAGLGLLFGTSHQSTSATNKANGAAFPPPEASVQPVPRTETQSDIAGFDPRVQFPAAPAPANGQSNTTPNATQPNGSAPILGKNQPSPTANVSPAANQFQHDFPGVQPPPGFQPGGKPIGGYSYYSNQPVAASQPAAETEAEMQRRLDREARLADTAVSVSGPKPLAKAAQPLAPAGAPQNFTPATAQLPGADIQDKIGSIAERLLAAGGQHPAAVATSPVTSPASAQKSPAADAIGRMQSDTLESWRVDPISPYKVMAGKIIPCALTKDLNSDSPGEIVCTVREPVKDTRTGRYVLIPQGAYLVGTYRSAAAGGVTQGQQAIEAIWTRLIFPDTSSLDLDGLLSDDARGRAGLRGKVDNHLRQVITATALNAVVSAGVALAANRGGAVGVGYYPTWQQSAGSGASQAVQQTGSQLVNRGLAIPPTIKVSAGTWFGVVLDKDIRFEGPYKDHRPLMDR